MCISCHSLYGIYCLDEVVLLKCGPILILWMLHGEFCEINTTLGIVGHVIINCLQKMSKPKKDSMLFQYFQYSQNDDRTPFVIPSHPQKANETKVKLLEDFISNSKDDVFCKPCVNVVMTLVCPSYPFKSLPFQ